MTTTDPSTAPAQPATPGTPDGPDHWHVTVCVHEQLTDRQRDELFSAVADAAHEVDDRWSENELGPDVLVTGALCRCLNAAPAVYTLPPEPPETVIELWDGDGNRWLRRPPHVAYGEWVPDDDEDSAGEDWPTLLFEYGPLSTAPLAGTEAQ